MGKIYNKFIKSCKRQGCLFLVAWIALFVSIVHIAMHLFEVWSFLVVDYSTFISACIGIISLLIVFVVGWQIYNALELKNSIKKQQEKIRNKLLYIDNKSNWLEAKTDENISKTLAISFSSSAEIYYSNVSHIPVDITYGFIYNSLMCILNFASAKDYKSCNIRANLLMERIKNMSITLSSKDQYARLINILGHIPNSDRIDKFDSLFETIMSLSYKTPAVPNPAVEAKQPQ